MEFNFCEERHGGLDTTLSFADSLQNTLDAGKHGYKEKQKTSVISLSSVLYGTVARVKTIGIDYDSYYYKIAYKWYSMCNLVMSDIHPTIEQEEYKCIITIPRVYMDLYDLSVKTLVLAINDMSKKFHVINHYQDDQNFCIVVEDIPIGIMSKAIRTTKFGCKPRGWQIISTTNIIYTVIDGDVYENMYQFCDEVICTNAKTMLNYHGKVNTFLLLEKYSSDNNVRGMLAWLMYSKVDEIQDFASMCFSDPMKKLTTKKQIQNLHLFTESSAVDNLTSKVSRLMVGADLTNDSI